MLVIVSDLHFTDGTTGAGIPDGDFRLFQERLEDMAVDASKRDEDTYQPPKSPSINLPNQGKEVWGRLLGLALPAPVTFPKNPLPLPPSGGGGHCSSYMPTRHHVFCHVN